MMSFLFGGVLLVPVFAWFDFKDSGPNPTYLVYSTLMIASVVVAQLIWQGHYNRRNLRKLGSAMGSVQQKLKQLEVRLNQIAENENDHSTSIQPIGESQVFLSSKGVDSSARDPDFVGKSNQATSVKTPHMHPDQLTEKREMEGGGGNTPKKTIPSEPQFIELLEDEFTKSCRESSRRAPQLVTHLQELIEYFGQDGSIAMRVFRDGSVVESTIYRKNGAGITSPMDSIAVLLAGGQILLLPAPLSGEDSFTDMTGFESNTTGPLKKRSQLLRCIAGRLNKTSEDCFELQEVGSLEFPES